jgi:hypothetical protein
MPVMKIISLGWGVQSFTLAAMSALGELEPVDFAIHADTTHESQLTYQFAARWTGWLAERGVHIVTVKPGRSDPLDNGYGQQDAPFYTLDTSNNNRGQSKRQCTSQWKIIPMRRRISDELERRGLNKNPGVIEQWIGISWDEYQRMHFSDVKYITHRWPLIDKKITRTDCAIWLKKNGIEIPPRSACTFCPFHNTAEWRRIKKNSTDWQEAVSVDRAIRKAHPPYDLFVHPARKPLEEVDLRTQEEKGQLSLWDNECSGVCGV